MSLVLELQAEAINGSVDVDHVLRKALAVAMKLGLMEFKHWVQLGREKGTSLISTV